MVEAVLKSSTGPILRRSRICTKQELDRWVIWSHLRTGAEPSTKEWSEVAVCGVEMTLDVVIAMIICVQLMSVVGQQCPRGFYLDPAVDDCEPCVNICDPGRGTESKCRSYADQCKEQNISLLIPSSTFALMAESNEEKQKEQMKRPMVSPVDHSSPSATESNEEKQKKLMKRPVVSPVDHNPPSATVVTTVADGELSSAGLTIGLFISSFCLLGVVVIGFVVTQKCKPQPGLGWIFRGPKSKTVQAVHPVEEGIGQIHPSSHTPPRMLFEMTRHALTMSTSNSSSSSSHSTAAVRLFSVFRETGKPQNDEEDTETTGANPGSSSSSSAGSYLIYTTLSTD